MKHIFWIIVLCLLAPGCAPLNNGFRTVLFEPHHYWHLWDGHLRKKRHRRLAGDVFDRVLLENPDACFSEHYADGFVDGFADYVFAGGTGEPPPLPPRRYWKDRYATPAGREAIQDWFDGFRFGAEVAIERGDRDYSVITSSLASDVLIPHSHVEEAEYPILNSPSIPSPANIPLEVIEPPGENSLPSPDLSIRDSAAGATAATSRSAKPIARQRIVQPDEFNPFRAAEPVASTEPLIPMPDPSIQKAPEVMSVSAEEEPAIEFEETPKEYNLPGEVSSGRLRRLRTPPKLDPAPRLPRETPSIRQPEEVY